MTFKFCEEWIDYLEEWYLPNEPYPSILYNLMSCTIEDHRLAIQLLKIPR